METKFRIVETEEYFLAVSDEDASNSYIYFTGDPTGIFRTGIKYKNEAGDYFYQDAITGMSDTYLTKISKKIIGYLPKGNAPELDLPLLPDVEDEVVEKLFIEKSNIPYFPSDLKETCNWWFREGHKAATKKYSEEDLRKAFEVGRNFQLTGENNFNELLLYLKRPKWFVAEVEKKMVLNLGIDVRNPNTHVYVNELKTTTINNKIYLEGTYLN
jgi:hypothetical protein